MVNQNLLDRQQIAQKTRMNIQINFGGVIIISNCCKLVDNHVLKLRIFGAQTRNFTTSFNDTQH